MNPEDDPPFDHEENAQRIQADKDRRRWDCIAASLDMKREDFMAMLGRFVDERIERRRSCKK